MTISNAYKGGKRAPNAVTQIDSIATLPSATGTTGQKVSVTGYHAGTTVGGGDFIYDSARIRSEHNGLDVHSTNRSLSAEGRDGYLTPSVDASTGCWVRVDTGTLTPEQAGAWSDGATNDTPAIQVVINVAQAKENEIFYTGQYAIGSKLIVSQSTQTPTAVVGMRSSAGAEFISIGAPECIDFQFISYYGHCSLPIMSGFVSYALALKGTGLANIFVPRIVNCGAALKLETVNATHPNVLDSNVEIQHVERCATAVWITADAVANVMQGNEIIINFIGETRTGIHFNAPGIEPNWDSNKVTVQAFDPLLDPLAKYLYNDSAAPVARFTTTVDSWIGAMAAGAKYIDGEFSGLRAEFNIADAVVLDGQFDYSGIDNSVKTYSDVRTSAYKTASLVANNKAGFNGGVALASNISKIEFPITTDFLAGTTRQFYIYNQLTDGFTNHFSVSPGEVNSQGVIWTFLIDQSTTNADEITLVALNVSGSTIPAGTNLYGYFRMALD